jgi:Pyridoxamine 5'-phosphate oxidase
MPKLTDAEIEDVLGRRRGKIVPTTNLHIATVTPDGWPWSVPVGFLYRDRTIYMTARAKTKWLENIRHDSRVHLTIDDDDYERRKVTIRGHAKIAYEPGQDDQWRDLRLPLRNEFWTGPKKLPDGSEEWFWGEAYTIMTWDEPRALVAVPLEGSHITSWRMPIVGEYLDEAWSRSYFHQAPKRFKVSQLGDTPDRWRVIAED